MATIDDLKEQLGDALDRLSEHRDLLAAIDEDPDEFDSDDVEVYLDALGDDLSGDALLAEAEQAVGPLKSAADEAKAERLAQAKILVDDREIEDAELRLLEPPRAEILVPSPQINQIRGGAQVLEMPDRSFRFEIEETLIEDVADDKSGYLKLVLSLTD